MHASTATASVAANRLAERSPHLDIVVLFDGAGHAVQWPPVDPASEVDIQICGALAGGVEAPHNHRIDRTVELFNPLDEHIREMQRRDFVVTDHLRQHRRRLEVKRCRSSRLRHLCR
jgi:hypothetical protein